MAQKARLSALFDGDMDVVSYLLAMLDDGREEGRPEGELIDELTELMGAHAIHGESEEALREIALEVVKAEPEPASAPAAPPPSTAAAARNPTAAAQQQRVPTGRGETSPAADKAARSSRSSDAEPPPLDPAAQQLVELMQSLVAGVSAETCRFLIERHGVCDEAADVLLTTPLETLEEQRREAETAAAAARKADEQADKAARKSKLERYATTEARAHGDDDPLKLQPPRLTYQATRKDTMKAQVTRYRDGEARTMKAGEKFVTEQKEEWDGGSKGRVKTKGKRGPGWIG